MSWDVLLITEKFDLDDCEDFVPTPLGKRDELITKLCQVFSNLDYSDKSWGILSAEEFSIEFSTGDEEIVDTIMLHVRGGGLVMDTIFKAMDVLNCNALDCSSSDFLNPKASDKNSWKEFQQFRDKVIGKSKN